MAVSMSGKKPGPSDNSKYNNLIHDNFAFIEKQCYYAVRLRRQAFSQKNHIDTENEALELSNRVLDQLTKNDFRVMKRFQKKSRLSTYLSTIIANQAIDLIRKKRGRNREKERAKQFGELGNQIYQKIVVQGLSAEKTYSELLSTHQLKPSRTDFDLIVEKIRGSRQNPVEINRFESNSINPDKTPKAESWEEIISKNENNPEEITIKKTQQQKVEKTLSLIIKELKGEERLILRMRYPASKEDPMDVEAIASKLGISKKAVYKRINRILNKCRTIMGKKGIDFHDLL